MPFCRGLDIGSAPKVWAILGWVAGRSFAATCRDAAAWLPGAADRVDLLQVLKNTPVSVTLWSFPQRLTVPEAWRALETVLRHLCSRQNTIENYDYVSITRLEFASVLNYMTALNAIRILPPISKALVSAVQLGLDEVWTGEGSLTKPWIAYALPCAWLRPRELATLQTNRAASLEASELTVFNVCREVTRMAVANSSGFIQIYSEEVVPFFL